MGGSFMTFISFTTFMLSLPCHNSQRNARFNLEAL
jgi:hypothetical protein